MSEVIDYDKEAFIEISVDTFMTVSLKIPRKMSALQFLGLLAKVKKAIPSEAIDDQMKPSTKTGSHMVWKEEWKDLIRKNKNKSPAEVAKILNQPQIPMRKISFQVYKARAGSL